jgi:hypothetical protein
MQLSLNVVNLVSIRFFVVTGFLLFLPHLSWGWDFSKHSIPLDEIASGGPPKDGIPALRSPKYRAAKKADFMKDDDRILGVYLNGIARAYPTRILSWHELVNDMFKDLPVLVSW